VKFLRVLICLLFGWFLEEIMQVVSGFDGFHLEVDRFYFSSLKRRTDFKDMFIVKGSKS
jgi:hypothetical protein